MDITQFDAKWALGSRLLKMGHQELCEFASKLCRRIMDEVGTRGRRGGIFPDNISVDADGRIGLGPSGSSPWQGEELKFVAPELYWNGQCSAASDVYSVGLILYYAVSGGTLPLEDECQDAQLRRMGGEDLLAPKNAGRRLGEVIEKCLKFKAADRFQNLEELRIMLDSNVKNLYLNGSSSAEVIFKKSDDDLSEIERMMVGIIENENRDDTEDSKGEEAEEVKVYAPSPTKKEVVRRSPVQPAVEQQLKKSQSPAVPKLTEDKSPALRPVTPGRQTARPGQYINGAEREKKIKEEVRKRRRRPLAVILVLCALLVVVAIIFNAMLRDFQEAKQVPDNTIDGMNEDPYSGTMPPQATTDQVPESLVTVAPQVSPSPTPSPIPSGHSYQIVVEDVSWTEARDKCIAMGGHLVVISDEAEFEKIIQLAETSGVDKIWIGCHREDGTLLWENTEAGYFSWAKGEPTYVDTNDNVAEDYVMLWDNNGWAMNDNRNDPISDYPQWYSGTVAYICEFGD